MEALSRYLSVVGLGNGSHSRDGKGGGRDSKQDSLEYRARPLPLS
jgi:hypothetical protein